MKEPEILDWDKFRRDLIKRIEDVPCVECSQCLKRNYPKYYDVDKKLCIDCVFENERAENKRKYDLDCLEAEDKTEIKQKEKAKTLADEIKEYRFSYKD